MEAITKGAVTGADELMQVEEASGPGAQTLRERIFVFFSLEGKQD